ncbi:MAG TPA: HEAT repeat domain-containing protein, partial [Planctomycetota bacterium]|nr:HEAT repeat domain-containing protein [Planctomycetota bacterium]
SLWFCDWNFGGWTTKGKETGRLIKATYTGGPSQAAARPSWYLPGALGRPIEATSEELVSGLSHPSLQVRLVAQRRLVDRKAVKELEGVVAHGKAPAVWHAIWALDALGGSNTIREALKDADPSVRRQAARELGMRKVKGSMIALIGLLKDSDASVRFQAATALGRIAHPVAIPGLQAALGETDLFARYAAIRAIDRIGRANSTAWADIVKGLASDQPRIREGTLFAIRETYEEPLVAALAAAPRSAETLSALSEIHRMPAPWKGQWWGTQPAAQPRPLKTVDYGGTKMAVEAIRAGLADPNPAVRRVAVEGTLATRDLGSGAALRELFARESDLEVKKSVLRAQGTLKDPAAADEIAGALRDPALQPEAVGTAEAIGGPALARALGELVETTGSIPGMEALGRLKTGGAAVARHLAHPEPKVAVQAAASLGQIGGKEAEEALLGALEDQRPEVRKAAIGSLGSLGVRGAVPALLKMYLDPATRFEAIGALAKIPDLRAIEAYLEGLGGRNAPVRDACRNAVGALGEAALPALEQRLDQQLLSGEVISELQRLFNRPVPILQWMILGSFPNPCPEPFAVEAPPMDREFKDTKGNPARWRRAKVAPETGRVTLNGQMPTTEDSTAYGVSEIESATDREVEFVGGSDDTLVVWLNGTKIFEDLTDKGWKADQYHFRGKLKTGKNLILIKCGNHGGAWEFSLGYPVPRKGRLFEAVAHKLDPKAYAEYAKKTAGDPVRGRSLFIDPKGVACIKCHKLSGEGGEVGPDLTGVGLKYGRDHFIESILYPSAKILDGYRTTVVLTKSGDVKSGRFLSETAEELTLMDQEGKRLVIRKADLEQRRESDVSM